MKYWIDRIEDDIAICENEQGDFIPLPIDKLPKAIHEGDCIEEIKECFLHNKDATQARKKQIRDKMNRLNRG